MLLGLLFTYTKAIGHRAYIAFRVYAVNSHIQRDSNTYICRHPKMPLSPSPSLPCVCLCVAHSTQSLVNFSIRYQYTGTHFIILYYILRAQIEVFIVALTDWLSVCLSVRTWRIRQKIVTTSNSIQIECDGHQKQFNRCGTILTFFVESTEPVEFLWTEKKPLECARTAIILEKKCSFLLLLERRQLNHVSVFPSSIKKKTVESSAMLSINWLNRCEHTTAQNEQKQRE